MMRVLVILVALFIINTNFVRCDVTKEEDASVEDAASVENDSLEEEEEDPIVEDLTKVDLSTLKLIDSYIQPNLAYGVECDHLKEEIFVYWYDALTASGSRVGIKLADRKEIPVKASITVAELNLGKNRNTKNPGELYEVEYTPYLDCLPMDHNLLVEKVKEMLDPPSSEEYNFLDLDANFHGETGHPDDVDRIVFGGQLKNGFFIEAGAVDFETFSDTLYFEINHNWTGLLVEAIPRSYHTGLQKHRKAYSIQTCLSSGTKPKLVDFEMSSVWREDGKKKSMGGIVHQKGEETMEIQCMPLYSILLALGNPTVHWISLDIEGAEFAVLKTIPWDKVDIQSLTVETHMMGMIFPGDREEFIGYMKSVGYRHIKDAHSGTNELRQKLGTIDDLFVRNDVPLAEERLKMAGNYVPFAEEGLKMAGNYVPLAEERLKMAAKDEL